VVQLATHIDVGLFEIEERTTLIDHPSEGEIREMLISITTSDVSMDSREPTLLEIHA
jgi:hypothetical protein